MSNSLILVEGEKSEINLLVLLFKYFYNINKTEIHIDSSLDYSILNYENQTIIIKVIPHADIEKVFSKLKCDEFSNSLSLSDAFSLDFQCDVEFLVIDSDLKDDIKSYPSKTDFLNDLMKHFYEVFIDENIFLILNSPMCESIIDTRDYTSSKSYKSEINNLYKGGYLNILKKDIPYYEKFNHERNQNLSLSIDKFDSKTFNLLTTQFKNNKEILIFNMIFDLILEYKNI